MNNVLEVIRNRRSTRKFKSEQIKQEELDALLEAGVYAPSAHNHQPWNFTVVRNKELLDELSIESKKVGENHEDTLIRKMGKSERLHIFYHAPTVIIVSGNESAMMPEIDCAAATENMLIAAESLDIGSCWCAYVTFLFESEKGAYYRQKLNIPDGYKPYYGIALGYKEVRATEAPKRKENCVQYID